MVTPPVRRSSNQSSQSKEPGKTNGLSLTTRRFAAWAAEITLVVVSGLVPFGIGVYANSRSDLNRVPLNPMLVVTERAIARPLALPLSYGTRNVAWPTNFLWTVAALAPLTLSAWQLYLLAKTGSTIPKRWFGVRVVTKQGTPPGLLAVLVREGIGRWALPMSVAYMLWRYTFMFPNLGLFTALAAVMILGEGTGLRWQRGGRALHDRLAGTYTIDATRPFAPGSVRSNRQSQSQWTEADEEAAIASIISTPEDAEPANLWERMRSHPSMTLFGVALVSMGAVLVTLVGTQIYIQTQENQRDLNTGNRKQFDTLVKQLSANSGASNEQRQNAILRMGALNDPLATKYLVDLLVKEDNPILLDTIQQALANVGQGAIPDLKRMNQFLTSEMENSTAQDRALRQKRLHFNQRAINKILVVESGKTNDVDLSRTQLGQSGSGGTSFFNLVLDKVDLWGVNFKGANLNQASFKGSRFRGPGEDRRWDTFDDWIADLSQAQMKQANFTDANLSRVLINRADLSRATLNRANLSSARLVGANLSSAQLVGADLRGTVLENASLTGADLGEANLKEANLFAARLGRAIAIGTQLSFANLTKTDWQGADLSGADLERANLSNASLNAARLSGAILRSTNMENANLRNADLSFVDLRGANLAGADFQGTILSPGKQDPADQFVQTPEIGAQSAVVQGVDFSQVKNLDTKQLAYICTQGGVHPRCP
ncbi:MAG: pentapeptide repeat-containing protein [Heteroscytonema crispum UTEX LB 1556]